MSRPPVFLGRRVFVDSAAHYALADPRDTSHARALSLARQLAEQRRPLFTSNFIVAESHALVLNRLGREFAQRLLHAIFTSPTIVVRVSAADERRAQAMIAQYTDKAFSYTDATSFAVMERLHIGQVFTFDSDFHQCGFVNVATVLGP